MRGASGGWYGEKQIVAMGMVEEGETGEDAEEEKTIWQRWGEGFAQRNAHIAYGSMMCVVRFCAR